MAISSDLTLPNGRKLSYAAYGSTSTTAPVVFYHHGFPASHAEARLYDTAAQKHETRLIAIDRPGMGNSTHQPNRQLLDWPAHLLALTDHLKVEHAGIVSGLYPRSLGTAGMLFEARMMLYVAPWLAGLVAFGLDKGLGVIARDGEHPGKFERALASNLTSRPPVDRELRNRELWNGDVGGFRQTHVESTREALRDGGHGPAWEARLIGSDWEFPLEELSAEAGKMFLWHGG
ncbi:hypothetical protein SCUP515_13028 [Seiridium cupressi]